ncbi:MAG TPA: hypothetical protein VMT18_03445 [Planctomycetota bacterium]|nr:hypothetical protein [Planctomycetota bacterium]
MGARRGALLGLLVLAATFVALARWTWGGWPDPLVDFGRELYVPWRLSAGALLQRDIAWFSGPLSQHVNAFLFRIAGISLHTLVVANLLVLAALTLLWWQLLRGLAGTLAATFAGVVLLAVFGFAQLVGIGNYNFVTPYSHEVTHGMLLATGALACLRRFDERREVPALLGAGLLLGLCVLTKVEVALAALVAVGLWLTLILRAPSAGGPTPKRSMDYFGVALLAPLAWTLVQGALTLGAARALESTFGGWLHALGGGAGELAFYRAGMGLDAPAQRLGELAWRGRWALLLAPFAALAWRLRRGTEVAHASCAAAALVVGALLAWSFGSLQGTGPARPLPLFALAIAAGAWFALRRAADEAEARRARALFALAAFAFVLLGKMILNARVQHYGFALALPATLLTIATTVGVLPAALERRGRAGWVLRMAALVLFAGWTAAQLRTTQSFLGRKVVTVGRGEDAFQSDIRGQYVNEALEAFAALAQPGHTLAVLPEGVMLNYLAESVNPTPFVNFMPPELLLFGEERILAAFEATPPDWILLVHKDTSEYGYPLFGPDYGTQLATWIRSEYAVVRQFAQTPLTPGTVFGIQLLKRR